MTAHLGRFALPLTDRFISRFAVGIPAGIKPAPPLTKILTGWGGLYARRFLAACITANRQMHNSSLMSCEDFTRIGTRTERSRLSSTRWRS